MKDLCESCANWPTLCPWRYEDAELDQGLYMGKPVVQCSEYEEERR